MKLTHNDYFTTSGNGKDWTVHLKPCTNTTIGSYHDELIKAAQLIQAEASGKINLFLSGGIDGEYMIRIFQTANIPFDVIIVSFGIWNEHDNKYAFEFCKQHNIDPVVIDIDIKKFIESGEIVDIATKAKCSAYQMVPIMHAMTKLDSGLIVMGNGEPYLKHFKGEWFAPTEIVDVWSWEETERVNSYMNWFELQGLDGTPDFLRYTAESTLSFLYEPIVKKLVANQMPGKLSTRTSKKIIYGQHYDFVPREKSTGWELLEESDMFDSEVFTNEFPKLKNQFNGSYELTYDELILKLTK